MSQEGILGKIDLPFPKISEKKTKIRSMYDISGIVKKDNIGLEIISDHISAYDVVQKSFIPKKGEVLHEISNFFFKLTKEICPNHYITDKFDEFPPALARILKKYRKKLEGRTTLIIIVDERFGYECIVRGSLLGSAWEDYQKTGKVCGIELCKGLKKGDKLPAPIFTPSTKAEYGEHDENVTFEEMQESLGKETARMLRAYSLSVYSFIANVAALKGIEIPDTKFEFGRLSNGQIIQIDEIGIPDSSRYIPDYSKQPFRDWLTSINYDKKTPIEIPPDIIQRVSDNYIKACQIITGKKLI